MLGKALISKRCLPTMLADLPPIQRDIVRDGTLSSNTRSKRQSDGLSLIWEVPEQGFGSSISSEVNQFEGSVPLVERGTPCRHSTKEMKRYDQPVETFGGGRSKMPIARLIASESLPLSRQVEALSKLIPFSKAYSKGATDPKRILQLECPNGPGIGRCIDCL